MARLIAPPGSSLTGGHILPPLRRQSDPAGLHHVYSDVPPCPGCMGVRLNEFMFLRRSFIIFLQTTADLQKPQLIYPIKFPNICDLPQNNIVAGPRVAVCA
jgi:hypothetical protein